MLSVREKELPLRMVFSSAFNLRTGSCEYALTRDKSDVRPDSPVGRSYKKVYICSTEKGLPGRLLSPLVGIKRQLIRGS